MVLVRDPEDRYGRDSSRSQLLAERTDRDRLREEMQRTPEERRLLPGNDDLSAWVVEEREGLATRLGEER